MAKAKKTKLKKRYGLANLDFKQEQLQSTIQKKWIAVAIEMMERGHSSSYIREHIAAHKEGSVTPSAINDIMGEANNIIVSNHFTKAEEMIPLHITRYNTMMHELRQVTDADNLSASEREGMDMDTYYKMRDKKVRAKYELLNTLLQKEQLLQYHNKDFVVELNQEEEIKFKDKVEEKLDINVLTLEEQIEFYQYLKRARVDENELLAVITSTQEGQKQITQDIDHEVVEQPNITGVEIEVLPPEKQQLKITREDPTIKLRESLKKIAAQRFKDAGGTLTKEEEEYLK